MDLSVREAGQRRGRPIAARPGRSSEAFRRAPLRRRLRYRFDNSLAHGPLAIVGWLGVVVVLVIAVAAVVGRLLLASDGNGFLEDAWQGLVRVLDASAFQSERAWPSRLVALAVTLAGIFLGGSLIGLIATAIDQRVADLGKGRSPVLESGHTLILGWSARLAVIVQELAVANENRSRPAIVVLAPRPISEMEEELRSRVGSTRNTRIVCRSGDPTRPADLALANLSEARSVIVLADQGGDASVVKAILAVKVLDPLLSRTNVVAEFVSVHHASTVRALTDGAVNTVNSDDVIAQVTAQACHQPGLSVVFRELLDFDGDECYFSEVPELVGHSYAEALQAFDTSSVIGRCTADGVVELNPSPDTVFGPGDQVIAISEDDDTVRFADFRAVAVPVPASPQATLRNDVRVLVVGWSDFGPTVVEELNQFLGAGSHIEVCVDAALIPESTAEEIHLVAPGTQIRFVAGGPEELLALADGDAPDQVIVLGYRGRLPVDEADSRTLLTLLTLRKMWPPEAVPRVRIIAQLLDQANVELANTTGVDDFIVSDALASLMTAQLSERAALRAVFDDLFDPNGAVVELRAAHRFVPDALVSHAQIVAAGSAEGVSVIGWRVNASGEVVINPPKEREVHLRADDQVLLVGFRAP